MPAASYHPQATVCGVGVIVCVRPGAGAGQAIGRTPNDALFGVWHAMRTVMEPMNAVKNAR